MEDKLIRTSYRFASKGHVSDMEFPSFDSLKHYLEDFVSSFPDVDLSDFTTYRVEIYELKN